MKRSKTPWITALAAAALLTLPLAGWAQTAPPSQPPAQPPTTQPPTTQPPTTQPPTTEPSTSAQEHLREAKAALDSIPNTAVTGSAKMQFAQLRRHIDALERMNTSPAAGANTTGTTTRSTRARGTRGTASNSWSTEVAAIDRILTNLLGTESTSGATTGTSGAVPPTPAKGRSRTTSGTSSTAKGVTLDEATRSKLMEVRTHITAYAAAMSGTAASPQPETTTPAPTGTSGTTVTTTGTETEQTKVAPPTQPQVDTEAARRHLTQARDTLNSLTQLPAASQLSGEARTQVSQLITNFNELITTPTDWRSTYAKVEANLNALIGPDNTDAERTGGVSTGTTGTTGTTGVTGAATAGMTNLDPAIRAKLVDMRRQLSEFVQASGGRTPQSAAAVTGTSGTAGVTGATGTTGTTTPPTSTEEQTRAAGTTKTEAMGHQEAMKHIEAIEAILNGTGATEGTTGTSASRPTAGAAGSLTLTQSQLEQLRMHLTELRKLVGEAEKK